ISSRKTATTGSSFALLKRSGSRPRCVCVGHSPMSQPNRLEESRFRWRNRHPKQQQLRRNQRHDSAPTRVAKPLRCCAPEEFRHSIPQRVVCRACPVPGGEPLNLESFTGLTFPGGNDAKQQIGGIDAYRKTCP